MNKKTISILLIISLVMIISISAVSAADVNETLQKEISDSNIAMADEESDSDITKTSSALQDKVNATSLQSESASDFEEIKVDDSRNKNHKVEDVSSASNDVLSASNDELLKDNPKHFYFNDGENYWFEYLYDAIDAAIDAGGGTVLIDAGTYTDDSWHHDIELTLDTKGTKVTLQPHNKGDVVIFDGTDSDGDRNENWFFLISGKNSHVTINDVIFQYGGAKDGGAIEVENGQLNLNGCIFRNNKAYASEGGGYGLGGAIDVQDGSLDAKNCQFINNWAGRYGGAICIEDSGSVTLENCYFEGNTKRYEDDGDKVANDFDSYNIGEDDTASWSFTNCQFKGDGTVKYTLNSLEKSVDIEVDVSDDVNQIVLYKEGSEYARKWCGKYASASFSDLDKGTYTIYMIKGESEYDTEKRYGYSGTTFSLIEPYFVLDDSKVFETLSEAVNAISSGRSGVITVESGTFTDSANFNVKITNKEVTIMPKLSSVLPVIFSGNSQSCLLEVGSNSKLTIHDITITGKFTDSALKFNAGSEGNISECKFNDISGNPINALNSNLLLEDSIFESNNNALFRSSVVNIDNCKFNYNSGNLGGAINADSSTDLTVTLSKFNANEASNGGAIYATNLKSHANEFIGNSAQYGGAVYITSLSENLINMTNCVFDLNNAAINYRNIYSESLKRKFNLEHNEYDLDLKIFLKDSSYGSEYILEGVFDWGSNLNNTYTLLTGVADENDIFGDLLTVQDNKFSINLGIPTGGTHEVVMSGMYTQGDSVDHFYDEEYYSDLWGNEFYLNEPAYAKILIDKGNITLRLEVNNVLIPETPVLNLYANFDLNYTVFVQNRFYQLEVVNGKGSMQLTDLDLGNYTVVAMRDGDENFNLAMNFTTFSISKIYSNFLVLGTNVEYDTLTEAVANSNDGDVIYIKKGTYADTGVVISNKTLDIIALEGAIFDAQGKDANFIIVDDNAEVYIYGITFTGIHNRNTNYGAIVNHGDLTLDSCNFTDNKITKISFAENGGAAVFSDGSSLDIDSCNFIRNTAPLKVSTAAVTSLGFADVSIMSSKFINNSARDGGAVYFKNLTQFQSAIISCDFEQNIAVKGSAIYVGNNSKYVSVSLSSFKKNDIKNNFGENTQLEGGVIYVNAGADEVVLDIESSNFENNANGNVDGGVICLDGTSKASIDGCIFNNNKGKLGSAILIKNPYHEKLTLFIESSSFINNNATTGAIVTSDKITTFIDDCIFANNTGENRHIQSNGFTIVHDSIFEVRDAKLNALSVQYGENSIISGTADIGTNIYAAANLTVAGENIVAEITNNKFTYETGILNHGKYYAVLNGIKDNSNNTYLMDSITEIFRVRNVGFDLEVSVDNITYGETIKVVEKLPATAKGTLNYQLIGKYYTKEDLESLILDAGNYTLVAVYDYEDFAFTSSVVNFEVYKANPTITVEDVEVEYNSTIIVNIKTNVPSIYTIEIEDYKTITLINGSKSIEIEKTFAPGSYTIKVTSEERVNYISNSTEAILKIGKGSPVFDLTVSDKIAYPNDAIINVSAPGDAVGNITYSVLDSNKNIVYTVTQSCRDNLIIPDLDAGVYEISAVFEGDELYDSDNIQMTFAVYPGDVELTLQYDNITYGEDLIIIPQFSRDDVEGEVIYVVGNTIRTFPINTVYVISGLDAGDYTIAAFYMGSNNYNPSKFLGTVSVRKSNSLLGTSNIMLGQSLKTSQSVIQSPIDNTVTNSKFNAKDDLLTSSGDDVIGDGEGNFIYQIDEDSSYQYFDTLDEAMVQVRLWEAGIITVRGGTYSGSEFCGYKLEGEIELTIRAFEGEEVIFDCEGEDYFLYLMYDEEVETTETPPYFEVTQTDGPTVTLENITVINGGDVTYGGAIDLCAGTLTLNNCNFRNNRADYGGAIYIGSSEAENDATVIALNTTFINNYAEGEGGAIYIEAGISQDVSASFYFCTFLDNHQGEDETYVINYFAGPDVDEIVRQYCVFNGFGEIYSVKIDKINQTVSVDGTSPDVFDSVVLLYDDQIPSYTIYNNGSSDFNVTFEDVMGGNYTVGVMNDHDFNTYIFGEKFEMIVPNFIISADEVYENLTDAIAAVADNGIIYANVNYYDEDNMEIDIRKSFTLKNFRDDGVTFDGSGQKWFFTIGVGCNVEFNGISFTDGAIKNYATIENYGNLIINNCSFEGFQTDAIIHNFGLLNILNTTFSLNFVDKALVWNDRDLVIDTVEFSSNIVNTSSVLYNNGAADVLSSNFTDNNNGGNGGAIYNKNSLLINSTVFSENEGGNGGAVYNEGKLQVFNSTFEDNTANGYGGAIFNDNELNIYNSTFTGGYSEFDGGALYNNNIMTVDNSTLVGNSATGNGGAIYNNKSLELTKSFFGINFAEEFANIYNAGTIQYSQNIFDFYDVILIVPDGQYGIPTTITGTLDPQFNMNLQVTLPGFINNKNAHVVIKDGVFEYVTEVLPKGVYDVVLNETLYDEYGNVYYGEAISDRLIVHKANVYINITVEDVVIKGDNYDAPVLKISASKNGEITILFNNKFSTINITDGKAEITLDKVGEGNYTVLVIREGDENYNDAVNTTAFLVKQYEGNFIVNSTGLQFDTLREAIDHINNNGDIIYVREGVYTGDDNIGLEVYSQKFSIIALGDVVFDAKSQDSNFLMINHDSEVTISDVVITGFNAKNKRIIDNKGIMTIDGCIFTNNTLVNDDPAEINSSGLVYNYYNLNIVDCEFYGNILNNAAIIYSYTNSLSPSSLIVNESTFDNNTINSEAMIYINEASSVKIISNVFSENLLSSSNIINAVDSGDVVISSTFYNNTQCGDVIYASQNSNLLVNDSTFTDNTANHIISSKDNNQNTISECVFTDNAAENVVLSNDKNLSVLESVFTNNTISGNATLNIAAMINASVSGCVFLHNKADKYRNIYSVTPDLNISNTTFDAINVDFTVHDIDYGQNETVEGSIDIGTNLNFTVNLDISSKIYSVNVTDNKFTCNCEILNGGDHNVVLNANDDNSNTFVFDKITKIFTVNRVDPGLKVSIANITQGEKLKVNLTINKSAKGNVVFEINGNLYTKAQLENLTLKHGNYLIEAVYNGDKNYLPANEIVGVKVNKIPPNITVSDAVASYGEDIKVNVTVDVADYYTVFLGNESISLFVENSATFTFPNMDLKPDNYEILVYVFESDEYSELYVNATLTVTKAVGVFNITNDVIRYGENASVSVKVPINAYGNITYTVYDENMEMVYTTVQTCLEELVIPNLNSGIYTVTGTFEGDSYYNNDSIINQGTIVVNTQGVELNITVSNITYGETATVDVKSNVDGEYLVYVGNKQFALSVINGAGNVSVSDLGAGIYAVNITITDDNYVAFNETVFEVAPKPVLVSVSVEDIVYCDDAIVVVCGEIDGEYIVEIRNQTYTVNVADGKGNTTISGLFAGEDILVSVSIVNANYSAVNTTTFNITPKEVNVIISVGNTTYTENTYVIIQADLDGDYIVTIRDVNYTVSVTGGDGVKLIPNLAVGENILASVSILDGNYSAVNTTTFNIIPKPISVNISIGNITYGEDAVVIVQCDVDGNYTVNIRDVNYTVSVNGGDGVLFVPNLNAGNGIAATVKREDNYTTFNQTAFNIYQKAGNVSVSVENITWDEGAIANVVAEIDGMYVLSLNNAEYLIEVVNGSASQVISGLASGNYTLEVAIVDSNYLASNQTVFNVAPKPVSVEISVENITYEEKALVIVEGYVDGDYLVYVGDQQFTVTVINGTGNVSVYDLTVGNHNANVSIVNSNYTAFNSTTFNVVSKQIDILLSVENITYSEGAIVSIISQIDGDYLVYIGEDTYVLTVNKGTGNITVNDLAAGNHTVAVSIVNGNYTVFNSTTLNVASKPIDILVYAENITYGEGSAVLVMSQIDGDYLVNIANNIHVLNVADGIGVITIKDLAAGNHTAVVTIVNGNYTVFNSTTFNVASKPTDILVYAENITYGGEASVYVISEIDGDYLVCIGNDTYVLKVSEGIGNITVNNLPAGNHTAVVTIVNGNYTVFNSTTFEVVKSVLDIDIDFGNNTYGTPSVVLELPENAGGNVSVYVNGALSQVVNLVNGSATIMVPNLNVGENNVTIEYSGDDNYGSVKKSVVLKHDTTIIASDMIKGYNTGVDYTAKLLDSNGSPLANASVTIKVDTDTFTVQTDADGVLIFNKKLEPGYHPIAIVNPDTGEYKLANLTIVKRITDNKDMTLFFGESFTFKVRLIGDDGKYVGADEVVRITIAGKTYSVVTDKDGYAKLKLTLKAKKYTITATYKGFTTKNTITVKSVVKPVKKTVKVKKTAKKLKIKVKLKAKKVLKKKKVFLKFKGKKYKAKTNKKGIAKFKVPKKVIKKLKKGKKYKATFIYKAKGLKNKAKCKVKVKK